MILARTQRINHPNGIASLQTPFLVPSFSTKGKRIFKVEDSKIYSEVSAIMRLMDDNSALTQYYLISAYDMYYNALPEFESLPRTEIIFIDSGGYEVSDEVEGRDELRHCYATLPWKKEYYYDILQKWFNWSKHDVLPAILITYDHPREKRFSFEEQIENALELKRRFPGQLYDILIKPENEQEYLDTVITKKVIPDIGCLSHFDIIGLTEKELGKSIAQRISNIQKLRVALDQRGIDKPIHIFGGLDPTLALFYFLAGAEIFDGVSWTRYQFNKGVASYHYNFNLEDVTLNQREDSVFNKMMTNNLSYLNELEVNMRTYISKNNFDHFGYMVDIYHRLSASF